MTKIQIRKVNGVPMGREKNPFSYKVDGTENHEWLANRRANYQDFEQSVTEHEAPGCEEGEAEGELIAQMYDDNDGYEEWTYSANPDRDRANGYTMRQIWIVSTPEKVEVKEVDNWIRVEDRLPEPGLVCLIYLRRMPNLTALMAIYQYDQFERFVDKAPSDRMLICYYEDVTYWQPLPKAPNV